jgi:hypothetical protein
MVKFLSNHEAMHWCSGHNFAFDWGLPDCSGPGVKFDIPVDAQKRVHLVKTIMQELVDATSLLIWFDDWMGWESGNGCPYLADSVSPMAKYAG